jgi:hypothetical protein
MKVGSINVGVLGQGNTAKAAIADMLRGWEDIKTDLKDDGVGIPSIDIEYTFDIGALSITTTLSTLLAYHGR